MCCPYSDSIFVGIDFLFDAGAGSSIKGPIIAIGSVLVNVMFWMILVIFGAFIDMKNENMITRIHL